MAAPAAPYYDDGLNKIYELLFCDDINLYKSPNQPTAYPWDILLSDKPAIDGLIKITVDDSLETRQRLLAYRLLPKENIAAQGKELLAVIIEVAMEEGPDTLAAFSDGTARYINHSGKLLVWETPTDRSDELIDELFASSETVVQQIGKWEEPRRAFPTVGNIRLNFLVCDGLYFGEGPFEVLQSDAMGGPVIAAAIQLMAYLVEQPS